MASMNFEINTAVRPCYVASSNKKALFHRWVTVANVIPPSNLRYGAPGGQIINTYALVEFEDGSMAQISHDDIYFDDGGAFNRYYWNSEEKEKENDVQETR